MGDENNMDTHRGACCHLHGATSNSARRDSRLAGARCRNGYVYPDAVRCPASVDYRYSSLGRGDGRIQPSMGASPSDLLSATNIRVFQRQCPHLRRYLQRAWSSR